MKKQPLKIILIRRDNIGDLVCTTPLFTALRQHFPDAHICALVNSYNVDVLANNPDVDEVYAYTKAKHREEGKSILGVYLDRLRLFARLRREHFDYAIVAGARFLPRALRLARMLKPKHIVGFTEPGKAGVGHIDTGIPYTLPGPLHETEDIFRLLMPFGITGAPPKAKVIPDIDEAERARKQLETLAPEATMTVGIHISARKVSQRWPADSFILLIRTLRERHPVRFMLFWSPGAEDNPLHPGDDNKANEIVRGLEEIPVFPYPTHTLKELIGGLSVCNSVICSDGGAMHLAAALGKPIVCFFGKSDASRWYPWGVPHKVLQTENREVSEISVTAAITAFEELLAMQASIAG